MRYRPSIKKVYQRSNSFIAILLNDTVIKHDNPFTSDDISLKIKNTVDDKDIDFTWEAGFATNDTIYINISPKEMLYGGKRSVLMIDFKNKIKIMDILKLLDNEYSIELTANPTKFAIGELVGILFHAMYVLLFIGLCVVIVADTENLSIFAILTAFQRIFILLLTNTLPSPFLSSFGKYFSIVSFKAVYIDWLFKMQVDYIDIIFNTQIYKSLGWFGYETTNLLNNSAGSLTIICFAIFGYMGFLFLFSIMKIAKAEGRKMDIFNKLFDFWPQILVIIQLLLQNDLALSMAINFGYLNFSNPTESYSSALCLICAVVLLTCLMIPLGLISNNKLKTLMSDSMVSKAGIYYQNVLKINETTGSFHFLNYYIFYLMLYSIIYSLVLVCLRPFPLAQIGCLVLLNGLYLVFSIMRPYNVRVLNILNILNHGIVFICSLLIATTLAADSYADYPFYASIS